MARESKGTYMSDQRVRHEHEYNSVNEAYERECKTDNFEMRSQ